jgi:hypothetical protein
MTNQRVSYVCTRAAELRTGKNNNELTQHEAFKIANEEYKNGKR